VAGMTDLIHVLNENPFLWSLLGVVGVIVIFHVHALIAVWLERKISAHIQLRLGPMVVGPHGLLQSMADGLKLLGKEVITPDGVDRRLFWLAPYIVLFPTMLMFVVVPFTEHFIVQDLDIGLLYFFSVASISTLGIFVAGWSSNNKYSLLGAVRSIAQKIAYEIPTILSLLTIVMLAGSLKMTEIVKAQEGLWFVFTQPVPFIIYLIASIAEINRTPFDIPEAESELVAGFHTEYSGMRFAIFFMAEYANMFLVSAIATTVFLGGWRGPLLPPFLWFLIKTYAVVFLIIWVRWVFPRLRSDQLLSFTWQFLTPVALVWLLATALVIKL
jgi:NADH-quinone oxidoreductase subunit H